MVSIQQNLQNKTNHFPLKNQPYLQMTLIINLSMVGSWRNSQKCSSVQQTKEQGKNLQDQINENKIGNLTEKEFRVMIVKMIQNLGNTMEKIQESFNKDLEDLKSKQIVMNNTINEIKSTLEGINSRKTEAEEWISDLEDKTVEITAREQNLKKRKKRIENSLRDLWDNIKHTNIQIIGVPEEERV